jgi:hypothetical protein
MTQTLQYAFSSADKVVFVCRATRDSSTKFGDAASAQKKIDAHGGAGGFVF